MEAKVYQTDSIRDLMEFINKEKLEKENIVSLFQDVRNNEFVLIYYI